MYSASDSAFKLILLPAYPINNIMIQLFMGGSSCIVFFWSLFIDPYTGDELVFDGVIVNDDWINGVLKSKSGNTYKVIDNVVVLIKDVVTGWSDEDLEFLRKGRWIERNWEEHMRRTGRRDLWNSFCREIAESNGLILDVADVASGPGGGLVP